MPTETITKKLVNGREYRLLKPFVEGPIDLTFFPLTTFLIDFEHSDFLRKMYAEARRRYSNVEGDIPLALRVIAEVTVEALKIQSVDRVDDFVMRTFREKGAEYSLDDHLREGVGNCEHSSATVLVLAERFKKEGLIKGFPSLGEEKYDNGVWMDGHAWARWRRGKKVWVADAMYGFIGIEADYQSTLDQVRHDMMMSH